MFGWYFTILDVSVPQNFFFSTYSTKSNNPKRTPRMTIYGKTVEAFQDVAEGVAC